MLPAVPCHTTTATAALEYLSKGYNFSPIKKLYYKSAVIISRHFAHTRTTRPDLIFQSQFCACLIQSSVYNCYTVYYTECCHGLWKSLKAVFLIQKIRGGWRTVFAVPSLSILFPILLLCGCSAACGNAECLVPPWARETDSAC